MLLLTNNPRAAKAFAEGGAAVELHDCTLPQLLVKARDYVHAGHKLLTHPLSGSVKPSETPYKSMFLSAEAGGLDLSSLNIIESAIALCANFVPPADNIPESVKNDFMEIDLSLVSAGGFVDWAIHSSKKTKTECVSE
ncbi:MAG: GrdX family protein [Oscillospiraceae bacterium]|nr:GrdX family protein [Oscillospiraceae bacterium]